MEPLKAPRRGSGPLVRRSILAAPLWLALLGSSIGQLADVPNGPPPAVSAAQAARLARPAALPRFDRRAVIPAPDIDFVRVGDVNNDQRSDFIGVDEGRGQVFWFENKDDTGLDFDLAGRLIPANTSLEGVNNLSPGDFNGDGYLDVVALVAEDGDNGTQVKLTLALNQKNETFRPFATIRRPNGQLVNALSEKVKHLEAAQIDNDTGGLADFFTVDSGAGGVQRVYWWKNQGPPDDPRFQIFPGTEAIAAPLDFANSRIEAADLTGDGLVDLIATHMDGSRVTFWRQTTQNADAFGGHGFERVFSTPKPAPGFTDGALMDISTADIDRDRDLDVLLLYMDDQEPRSQVYAWMNDQGTLKDFDLLQDTDLMATGPTFHRDQGMWTSIDVGDINRDGALDFVATEPMPNGRLCWYQNPLVPPTATPTPTVTTAPTSTASPTSSSTSPPTPTSTAPPTNQPSVTPSRTAPPAETLTATPPRTNTPRATPTRTPTRRPAATVVPSAGRGYLPALYRKFAPR